MAKQTDRELLEAAANRTGRTWKWVTVPRYGDVEVPGMREYDRSTGATYWPGWNPLESSSDAFELLLACPWIMGDEDKRMLIGLAAISHKRHHMCMRAARLAIVTFAAMGEVSNG